MTGGEDVFKYKQCLILRTDLKLSCGKKAWMREGQKKVALKAPSERALYELKATAEIQGLPVSLIIDAGYTEIPPGTVTALGIGPAKAELIDKVTGNLPLL